MCIRIGLEMGLYEMLQAEAGRQISSGELTEALTLRLEKKGPKGLDGKENTLRALIEERHDLMGMPMNLCLALT